MPISRATAAACSGPGAAIGDQREIAGIEAALGGHAFAPHRTSRSRRCAGCRRRPRSASSPSGVGDLARSSPARRPSTSSRISPPRKRSAPSRPSSRLASVTVGSVAAAAVAGRARHRRRRSAGRRAARRLSDARDAAAAGADLEDVDHRDLDRQGRVIAADQRAAGGQHAGRR